LLFFALLLLALLILFVFQMLVIISFKKIM
jgi:hypothetical protein